MQSASTFKKTRPVLTVEITTYSGIYGIHIGIQCIDFTTYFGKILIKTRNTAYITWHTYEKNWTYARIKFLLL